MIAWWWMIPAIMIGCWIGIFLMAAMNMAKDDLGEWRDRWQ